MHRLRLTRWLTLRSLRTRPSRTLLSMFGIVLGVASLLAIQITNLTALDALSALFEGTAGKTDLVVTAARSDDSVPERLLRRVLAAPDVAAAAPTLRLPTALAVGAGSAADPLSLLGFDMGGFLVYGIDPALDPAVRDYTVTGGRFLEPGRSAQEIVLVETFAADNDLSVGNTVPLLTDEGPQTFEIVGLIAREGAGQNNNGAFGVIPLPTAQALFHRGGEVDQIEVVLAPGNESTAAAAAARDQLGALLGADFDVSSAAAQGDRVSQMLSGFSIGLNFMGGMALFVGGYLIYNAFSMTVVERTREFGLLRTLGLTRSQVVGQVLVEAGILGLGGSALGVVLGIGLARGAAHLLALLLDLGTITVLTSTPIILSSLAVGLVVTLIAALIPAWQAGRISPLEALRVRSKQREGWLLRRGWIIGLLLLIISAVILVINPFPYDVQFRLGSVTVVLLFFGGTLLIPGSVELWEWVTRPLVGRLYGAAGRLGSSNIQRGKLRTTLTVAALMVGVSMIVITRGMTDSFRGDLDAWISAYVGGDLLVSSPSPLRPQTMRRLEGVDGVAAVTPMRTVPVVWQRPDGGTEDLVFMGVDTGSYHRVTSFVFSDSQTDTAAAYGELSAGRSLFISSVLAEKYDLRAGDTLLLRTRSGQIPFTVAAVVVNFFNQGLTIQGSWSDMRRFFNVDDADAFLVNVADGRNAAQVQATITATVGRRQNLSVTSNAALIEQVDTLLNQAYSMFDLLAIIAMFVGALGVVNTLTMNVVERVREIGMLRSIGLTRGQTLLMVLAEALLMGLIGGVLGLGFGLILTRIFLWSMTAMSGYKVSFVLPMQAVVASVLLALVVSQLAALFPARRAARTPVLDAIQFE